MSPPYYFFHLLEYLYQLGILFPSNKVQNLNIKQFQQLSMDDSSNGREVALYPVDPGWNPRSGYIYILGKTLSFWMQCLFNSIKNLNITEGSLKHPSISQFSSYLWHIWHFAQIWLKLPTVPPSHDIHPLRQALLRILARCRRLSDVYFEICFSTKLKISTLKPNNWLDETTTPL